MSYRFNSLLEESKEKLRQLENKVRTGNDKSKITSESRDLHIIKKDISLPSLLPLNQEIDQKKEELKKVNRENLKISYEIEDYLQKIEDLKAKRMQQS